LGFEVSALWAVLFPEFHLLIHWPKDEHFRGEKHGQDKKETTAARNFPDGFKRA
jgi:hypothetical protein